MRKFTKYPSDYIKADRHWRSKTECKTKNGKIVHEQNVSAIYNDQDYYVLYDADGNFVEKNLDFNYLHDKLYDIKSTSVIKATSDINPYMKDLAEYLDYLSDAEIDTFTVDTYNGDMEPTIWVVIPEHLRTTVENAVGIDLCTPSENYFYQIEYHPDDDSIFFGIDTDKNVETLNVSKETEDRFKNRFREELGL